MLEENHLGGATGFKATIPDELYKWNEQDKIATFLNGSRLRFGHLETARDLNNYLGGQYGFIGIDELTQFSWDEWVFLTSSNRSVTGGICNMAGASNPGGRGACVPYGEVLTPTGWRDIKTMQVGDAVFTVKPDGHMVEGRVGQVHSVHFDGELVRASARGFSLVCTPDHRVAKVYGSKEPGMLWTNAGGKPFSLVRFDEMPGQVTVLRSVKWAGQRYESVTIPPSDRRATKSQPTTVSGDLFFEFMGWFLSEGSAGPPTDKSRVSISQTKPEGRDQIRDLLKRMGLRFQEVAKDFVFSSPAWADYLRQFGKCYNKFVPTWMKAASQDQLALLFRALMAGDGHWQSPDGGGYYTTSRQLADDVSEIALKLGYVIKETRRRRPPAVMLGRGAKTTFATAYEVRIKRIKSGGTELLTGNHRYKVGTETKRRSDVTREPFNGTVHCIGVEGTETFLMRQDGCVWVSGNSWVKALFITGETFQGWEGYRKEDYDFIPAKVWDNPHIALNDPDYVEKLFALPERMRLQFLEGSWDVAAGQYYDVWDPREHVIRDEDRTAPEWADRWIGIDYGWTHSSAVCWGEADEDKECVTVYREFISPRMTPGQLAETVVNLTGKEKITAIYGSPDAFDERHDTHTVASAMNEVFTSCDLPPMVRADNKRVQGASHMYQLLRNGQLKFTESCKTAIRVIPQLQTDPDVEGGLLKEAGDDIFDSARYCIFSRWSRGRAPFEVRVERELKAIRERTGDPKDMTHAAMQTAIAAHKARQMDSEGIRLYRRRRPGLWRYARGA
jgi:hypothetical protein